MKIYFRDCPKLREMYSYNDEEELFIGIEVVDGNYRWLAGNPSVTEMLSWHSLRHHTHGHMSDFLKEFHPEALL